MTKEAEINNDLMTQSLQAGEVLKGSFVYIRINTYIATCCRNLKLFAFCKTPLAGHPEHTSFFLKPFCFPRFGSLNETLILFQPLSTAQPSFLPVPQVRGPSAPLPGAGSQVPRARSVLGQHSLQSWDSNLAQGGTSSRRSVIRNNVHYASL